MACCRSSTVRRRRGCRRGEGRPLLRWVAIVALVAHGRCPLSRYYVKLGLKESPYRNIRRLLATVEERRPRLESWRRASAFRPQPACSCRLAPFFSQKSFSSSSATLAEQRASKGQQECV